uniref:Uncharacterized protein n=1 Tax=Strigops habroptila TaxID=2489341 RepID=A0A672V8S8_STRHB
MLATLMTALFFMVRAFGQLGSSLFHEEPLPYLVYQPLPWQIQCVTQSRRTSRDSEVRAGVVVLLAPRDVTIQAAAGLGRGQRSSSFPWKTENSVTPERGRISQHNSIYSISGEKGNVTPDASNQSKFFSDPSEKAAVTIQTHFRRYQQQKQEKK